jgi:UDP:flavonoid glycosyltransferase YjiC (YdhE family)
LPVLFDAVASVPVRVLLTLGGVIPAWSVGAPPNVTVRGYLPHGPVLPHMAGVVSHGGLSTITSALGAGVPLLCIPQGRDQHANAAQLQASGAGLAQPAGASVRQIALSVERLVADEALRKRAREFRAGIDALGRGGTATSLVEQLAPRTGSRHRQRSPQSRPTK